MSDRVNEAADRLRDEIQGLTYGPKRFMAEQLDRALAAERATAAVDVERLRLAMWGQEPHGCDNDFGNCARIIAAEYARLSGESE